MWHLLPKSALFIQQYFSLKRVSSDPEGQSRTGMPRDDLSCAAQTRQRQLRRLKSTVICPWWSTVASREEKTLQECCVQPIVSTNPTRLHLGCEWEGGVDLGSKTWRNNKFGGYTAVRNCTDSSSGGLWLQVHKIWTPEIDGSAQLWSVECSGLQVLRWLPITQCLLVCPCFPPEGWQC